MRFYRRLLLCIGLFLVLSTGLSPVRAAPVRQSDSRIAYNEIVHGTITESDPEQEWTFSGHAGDLVLIDLRADNVGLLDTYLTLMDANGSTLMSDDDSGDSTNSRIGPYPLPSEGNYTIVVGRYSGGGAYTLGLQDLRTIPTLVPNKPLVGVVNAEHPSDYFLIDTGADPASEIWKIKITDDDPVYDAYMALYGPSGYVTGTESAIDTSALDPIVPFAGQSYVVTISWNPNSTGGPYEVSLSPSEMELLQDGVIQEGALDYDNYSRQHYFRGEEGDTIRVTAKIDGDIALGMSISSADYSHSLYSSEGENAQEVSILVTLPVSTVYLVEIHDGSYMGNSGSYSVQVDWVP
jgi:hypothetical protein